MSKYLQPSIRGVIEPSRGNYIGPPDMTLWEHEYRKASATHSYRIRDEWTETDRDFMAYWNLQLQRLIGRLGHPSARPVMAMNRWLQPIWRDGADPKDAPADKWREYERETATLWDSLSQDERDAVRGLTPEQQADRAAWEALPAAEKERLRSSGRYWSTRKHIDGRIVDDDGNTVGRWDDNRDGIRQFAIERGEDPDAAEAAWRAKQDAMPLIEQVRAYAAETHHGAAHVRRWNQVLTALGHDTGERAMTIAEAERNLARFSRRRWAPVVDAMRQMAEARPGSTARSRREAR